MRLELSNLEELPSIYFVLIIGLVGGVALAIPNLMIRARAAAAIVTFLVGIAADALVWWLSVRRRRYAVWHAALQGTAGVGLAALVSAALQLSQVWIEHRFSLIDALESNVILELLRSPLRFVIAAAFIALGRLLPARGRAARQTEWNSGVT